MSHQNRRRWYPRNHQNINQHDAQISFNSYGMPPFHYGFLPPSTTHLQEGFIFQEQDPRTVFNRDRRSGNGFRGRSQRNQRQSRGSRRGRQEGFGRSFQQRSEEEHVNPEFAESHEKPFENFVDEEAVVPENQRDDLAKQLISGSYECMICCNYVRRQVAIWSCDNCFHIFHLFCIKKWSQSMKVGVAPISPAAADLARSGHKVWRCPACQKEHTAATFRYSCFCGKATEPEPSPHVTPHSCGELCAKPKAEGCPHSCTLLCHPGPCPSCDAFVPRTCLCGAITATAKCASGEALRCEASCRSVRSCGRHKCGVHCHAPPCPPCEEEEKISCFCGATSRSFICGSPEALHGSFSCEATCGKALECSNHTCSTPCHPGPCAPCQRQPDLVVTCPCGKVPIADLTSDGPRTSCLDPIPTCSDGVCSRDLPCGHPCPLPCHDGACGACDKVRVVTCRCGKATREVPCAEWDAVAAGGFLCQRRCRKKKSCGRCRCGDQCCINVEHICMELCNNTLSCGKHTCEQLCHLGRCAPCQRVTYEELRCECGACSLPPPIACGTPLPDCHRPCSRRHACTHPVRHNCHAEPQCPPCTFLVSKPCFGGHTQRHNIPCSQRLVTCGQPCNKRLEPCGHLCNRPCHSGDCLVPPEEEEKEEGGSAGQCQQACQVPRPDCGHSCGAPCHFGSSCPLQPCRQDVEVKCGCGLRKKVLPCHSLTTLNKWELWGALQNSQHTGTSIEVEHLSKKTRQLECDSLCLQVERNRQLAEALNIEADPMPTTTTPTYTRFLRDFARSFTDFGLSVERSLDDLIRTAKESKHKSRSHSFAPMNRDKRRFVHELAEFYFCDTQSYDAEPNRSVVVTARKERARPPTVKLSALIAEELRQEARLAGRPLPAGALSRAVPAPSMTASHGPGQGLRLLGRVPSIPNSKPEIDYFSD